MTRPLPDRVLTIIFALIYQPRQEALRLSLRAMLGTDAISETFPI
jgi:hypothetical protein